MKFREYLRYLEILAKENPETLDHDVILLDNDRAPRTIDLQAKFEAAVEAGITPIVPIAYKGKNIILSFRHFSREIAHG
jgi:hypothetical protein